MSDEDAGRRRTTGEFRRERSQPVPPGDRRSPRSGRVTVPSARVRRHRNGLLLMSVFSVLVLLASGTSWAITGWVSGSLNRFDVFGGLSDGERPAETGGLTFLVIGSDSRGEMSKEDQNALSVGSTPGQRSDAIMLVRLNHERDHVTVIGLPRDLWVDIPGEGDDKINAAYAYGGPQLAVQTVESVTDVRIDHYVEVDFNGFVDVVDALDGIDVCLPEAINDPKAHLDMAAGTHRVDGKEALAFSRTRATARGDLDRIDRQQQVLSAMLDRAMSTETLSNPTKLTAFLDSALSSVTVDEGLDTSTINDLAYQMRDLDLGEVTFAQVPIADMNHWTPRGDVALLWDEPAARRCSRRSTPTARWWSRSPRPRPTARRPSRFRATSACGCSTALPPRAWGRGWTTSWPRPGSTSPTGRRTGAAGTWPARRSGTVRVRSGPPSTWPRPCRGRRPWRTAPWTTASSS